MTLQAEIESEPLWTAERVSDAMDAVGDQLRAFWAVGPNLIGCKGDWHHTRGRHRSRDWTRGSSFCTNRSYGDSHARDRSPSTADVGPFLRAFDIEGMAPVERFAMNHRLDDAVRAGRLPCVAEWWGTFNGNDVVGWFQGQPDASADSSHLNHTHVGIWTDSIHDQTQLTLLGNILMGRDNPMAGLTDAELAELRDGVREVRSLMTTGKRLGPAQTADGGVPIADEQHQFYDLDKAIAALDAKVTALAQGTQIDYAQLGVAIVAALPDTFADIVAGKVDALIAARYTS
jgi:hypothetical protein